MSWLKNLGQGIAQAIGTSSNSYETSSLYSNDDRELDRLENNVQALVNHLSTYAKLIRDQSEAAIKYSKTISTICGTPVDGSSFDMKEIVNVQQAYQSTVVVALEKHLGIGHQSANVVKSQLRDLRLKFNQRKENTAEKDSINRKLANAEATVRSATDPVSSHEARVTVQKLVTQRGNVDSIIYRLSNEIRDDLIMINHRLRDCATECGLMLLSSQSFLLGHGADMANAVIPRFPGTAAHLCELSDLSVSAAIHTSSANSNLEPVTFSSSTMRGAMNHRIERVEAKASLNDMHKNAFPAAVSKSFGSHSMPKPGEASAAANGLVRGPNAGAVPQIAAELSSHERVRSSALNQLSPSTSISPTLSSAVDSFDSFPLAASAAPSSKTSVSSQGIGVGPGSTAPTRTTVSRPQLPPNAKIAVGTHAFVPEAQGEIPLEPGLEVLVLQETDDGWWRGRRLDNGKEGLFPFNRVRILAGEDLQRRRASINQKLAASVKVPTLNPSSSAVTNTPVTLTATANFGANPDAFVDPFSFDAWNTQRPVNAASADARSSFHSSPPSSEFDFPVDATTPAVGNTAQGDPFAF